MRQKRYINILQGKTGRWIEGLTDADGLYTDEITTCKIIIIHGLKDGKQSISLTHYDGYTNFSDINDEFRWFDSILRCKVLVRQDQLIRTEQIEILNHVFIPGLRKIDPKLGTLTDLEPGCGAVTVELSNSDLICMGILPSSLRETQLINHPQAISVYAIYKINVMFAEIEGDLKFCQYEYRDTPEKAENQYFKFEGEFQHITQITKKLAEPVHHSRVIYDGISFQSDGLYDHDYTSFSRNILKSLINGKYKCLEEIKVRLAISLSNYEKSILLSMYSSPTLKDWYTNDQTQTLALLICQVVFHAYELLPSTLLQVTNRYATRYPLPVVEKARTYSCIKLIIGEDHMFTYGSELVLNIVQQLKENLKFGYYGYELPWIYDENDMRLHQDYEQLRFKLNLTPSRYKASSTNYTNMTKTLTLGPRYVSVDGLAHFFDSKSPRIHHGRSIAMHEALRHLDTHSVARIGIAHLDEIRKLVDPDGCDLFIFVGVFRDSLPMGLLKSLQKNTQVHLFDMNKYTMEQTVRTLSNFLLDSVTKCTRRDVSDERAFYCSEYTTRQSYDLNHNNGELFNFAKKELSKLQDSYDTLRRLEAKIEAYNVKVYNRNGSFHPSMWATKQQPYGPYSDHCCCPNDGITEELLKAEVTIGI